MRLGLEWFLNPDHVPLLLAQERGWLRDAGIELELVEPEEHFDAMAEIRAGSMEAAITEPIHLVEDRAKGDEVVGFARFLHTNGGVMYFEKQGIERPRDMAGKRVQYPGAPGPTGLAIVKTMVEADGGTCDLAELTPVNNGFHHTDALIECLADVATLVFYNFEIIEARGRGQRPGLFALKDWGVPDFCQLILITSEAVLAGKRPQLEALVGALRRGVDAVHQSPTEARIIYERHAGAYAGDALGEAIFDATLPCFTYDFSMSAEFYEKLAAWLEANDLIESGLDLSACWTNELAL